MTILSGQNGCAPPVWNVIAQAQSVIANEAGHRPPRAAHASLGMAYGQLRSATLAMTMGSGDHAKRVIAL